jgi:integrase
MPGHVRARKDRNGRVRKRADGSTIWQARYPDPSKGGTAKIERSFKNKRAAERWLAEMEAAKHAGTFVDPRRGITAFTKVADEWRGTWLDLAPKTRAGYEAILSHHLEPKFGGLPINSITPDRVQAFVNQLAARRSPNTVRRVFTVLRGVMRVAVERRYIAVNPCEAVKLPSKRTGVRRAKVFLTPEEVRTLAEAMPEPYRVPVYVAAWCGLRAGELWALRRRDVDLVQAVIRVERALKEINSSAESLNGDKGLIFGAPKSEAAHRAVSMPAPIRSMLTDYLAQPLPGGQDADALVFTTPSGKPVRHNLFYKRSSSPPSEGGSRPAGTRSAGTTCGTPAPRSRSPSRRTCTSSRNAWAMRTSGPR